MKRPPWMRGRGNPQDTQCWGSKALHKGILVWQQCVVPLAHALTVQLLPPLLKLSSTTTLSLRQQPGKAQLKSAQSVRPLPSLSRVSEQASHVDSPHDASR